MTEDTAPVIDSNEPQMHPSHPTRRRANRFGIAGFIIALVGIPCAGSTLGLLPLVGTIASAIGLHREPRGLAIAGLVLGIAGIVVTFIVVPRAMNRTIAASNNLLAERQVESIATDVLDYAQTTGAMPERLEQVTLSPASSGPDPWGNPIVFRHLPADGFRIISLGPDGLPRTTDDVVWAHPEGRLIASPLGVDP